MAISSMLTGLPGIGAIRGIGSPACDEPSAHQDDPRITPWGDRQRAHDRRRRAASLAAATISASVIVALLLYDQNDYLTAFEQVTWLLCNLLLLTSAWALYSRHRLTGDAQVGWLAAAVLSLAAHPVPFALLDALTPAAAYRDVAFGTWSGLVTVLPTIALVALARRARPITGWWHPLAAGVLAGLSTGAIRLGYLYLVDNQAGLRLPEVPPSWPQLLISTAVIGIAALLVRMPGLPRIARVSLAVVPIGMALGYLLHPDVTASSEAPGTMATVISLLSTVLLAVVCLTLLAEVLHDQGRRLQLFRAQAEEAQAYLIRDEEVLHELRATVAGVSAASELLFRGGRRLSQQQRRTLEDMMANEMTRLGHLLRRNHAGAATPSRLDEIIGPLVVGQRSLGVDVVWKPSGQAFVVDRARLAEAIHVLLTNAAHHAPGSTVTVEVRRLPDAVEVIVSDDGPGVPPELRDWIFECGIRSPASHGQGLGLPAARRLVHELNGSLTLAPPEDGRGACFVLRLPLTHESEV